MVNTGRAKGRRQAGSRERSLGTKQYSGQSWAEPSLEWVELGTLTAQSVRISTALAFTLLHHQLGESEQEATAWTLSVGENKVRKV